MPNAGGLAESEVLRAVLAATSLRVAVFDCAGRPMLDPIRNGTSPYDQIFERLSGLPQAVKAALIGQETRLTSELGGAWFTTTVSPHYDTSGAVSAVIAVANVTSHSSPVERALAEVQTRERRLFDSSMLGMLYWNESGAITDANNTFLTMTGYTREDIHEGRVDWVEMTPPEYRHLDRRGLEEIAERGVCTPFEKQYLRKDGRRIDVLIGGAVWAPGEASGVAFIVDIDQRKCEERERREVEERLRRVVEAAPIVLWSVDTAGTFTLSTGRGLKGLGLEPGQVVGLSVFELYAQVPEIEMAVRRCLRGEEFAHVVEVAGRTFENLYTPLHDAAGFVSGVLGVAIDITERRRAEAEREKLRAQLLQAQKLESLGLLAGGIAHDFNNLLTPILGGASTALMEVPESSSVREDLELVVSAARRAAVLTRQMLAYSGKAQVAVRALDLSTHVREIATLIHASVSKKAELRLELRTGLPSVQGDISQLQQIVMNLVINAAEAIGDRSGSVFVTTAQRYLDPKDTASLIAADGLPAGEYVCLEVRDTGTGMDEATQAKIFDPFFTTKFTGRGLGLAAVLGIVRAHRGAIRVESQLGRGTSFTVFFPAVQRPAEVDPPPNLRSYRGRGPALVIDDDPGVRDISRRMLEAFGFSVRVAADGETGAATFAQGVGDWVFVLLDLTMPKMNGEETLRAIRLHRTDVPVILMSGYNELEATRRFVDRGFSGFLEKPFTSADLAQKLEAALDMRATR